VYHLIGAFGFKGKAETESCAVRYKVIESLGLLLRTLAGLRRQIYDSDGIRDIRDGPDNVRRVPCKRNCDLE